MDEKLITKKNYQRDTHSTWMKSWYLVSAPVFMKVGGCIRVCDYEWSVFCTRECTIEGAGYRQNTKEKLGFRVEFCVFNDA